MKILFVVPYTPTLIRTRPYNLIRSLIRRGHSLTVATLWESDEELQALRRLAEDGARVISTRLTKARSAANMLGELASNKPLQSVYCWQPELMRQISAELAGAKPAFDVVHVEHLRGAQYGLRLKAQLCTRDSRANSNTRPVIVWDSVDCISLLFDLTARHTRSPIRRWIARLELPRTRRHEGYLASRFDRVLATSPMDAAALRKLVADSGHSAASPILVLPNGVDLDYFTPNFGDRAQDTLVLTGKMSYHANLTAALHLVQDIMPHVWIRRPKARVVIAGKAPPREVQALAVRNSDRVLVTGTVPDLRPHLQEATIAVVPLVYGAGSQFKVFEAMACATPVVATPQATSAFQARSGEDLLVAEDPKTFANEILRLFSDEALRRRIGTQGHRYVTEHHHWAAIAGNLEEIYQECLNRAV